LFDYDETNGTLFKINNANEPGEYVFSLDFRFYMAYQGAEEPASGAYIFRPNTPY
jgi:hypothetical protein